MVACVTTTEFGETKEPEFRIHVTRFRGRRIFAELREVVGYLWQETFVQDVKASTQVLDDGFGGVLDPKDTHREASLRELLRHAVKEMLRNLDDRSIMHRFMGGLMKHYHIRFLHSEFDALQVQVGFFCLFFVCFLLLFFWFLLFLVLPDTTRACWG